MKRFRVILSIILFVIFLFGTAVSNIFLLDTREISEREKRTLAGPPEISWENLRTGVFAEQFDAFINDRFMMRDRLTDLGFRIETLYGLSGEEDVEIVTIKHAEHPRTGQEIDNPEMQGPDLKTAAAEAPEQTDDKLTAAAGTAEQETGETAVPEETQAAEEKVVEEVLIVGNKGVEIPAYDPDLGQYFSNAVYAFTSRLTHAVNSYAIIVPTHISFLEKYADLAADQREGIQHFYSKFREDIITIDAFSALDAHKDEYIFFRTDHHWTAVGAYYVYREFCRIAGFVPVSMDKYERIYIENFYGSMYSHTLNENLAENPDTLELFVPYVDYDFWVFWNDVGRKKEVLDMGYLNDPNQYQIFISSDQQLAIIKNDVFSERKIMIFKDSFANAFIPFLMPHYREIHIIDPRYFPHNAVQYCDDFEIDDVLFFNTIGMVGAAGGYAWYLNQIAQLPYSPEPWKPVQLIQE